MVAVGSSEWTGRGVVGAARGHVIGNRPPAWLMVLLGMLCVALAPVAAEPAVEKLVVAKDIGDIITFDPAEAFELTTGEVLANVYDRIMMFEPEAPGTLTGGVAESHRVNADGRSITLRIREGLRFHSGNPVRPEDVEFSLERVVKRNGLPAFIVTQFGWNTDNVGELIEVEDERHVRIELVKEFSPRLVLHVLSAGVGAVVDRELVLSHEQEGDLGAGWLQGNSAGSGPFRLRSWQANEAVVLEANPGYRHGAPGIQRVVLRHVPEPGEQRELLERGEVDVARDLTPELIATLADNTEVVVDSHPRGTVVYLGVNAGHPILGKAKVVDALRHAVDYEGMADTFLAGQYLVHQTFWPRGMWAAYTETPYRLDIARAKALLEEAGHGDGFAVRIDTLTSTPYPAIAEAVAETFTEAGIDAEVVVQEGPELWPQYRAREHEVIVAPWSPDYADPHANADAFARNPDNRPEANLSGVLAWRNGWAREEFNAAVEAARNERDPEERAQQYRELQRRLQEEGPYVIMFQQTEQMARRSNVTGLVTGPAFDQTWYRAVTKQAAVKQEEG